MPIPRAYTRALLTVRTHFSHGFAMHFRRSFIPSLLLTYLLVFSVGCKIERVEMITPEVNQTTESTSGGIDEETLRKIIREELAAVSVSESQSTAATKEDADAIAAMTIPTNKKQSEDPGSEQPSKEAASKDANNGKRPTVAYVTNGIASFWTIAEAGCKAAAKDLDVECLVRMPPDGAADQKRMLEELINMKVDGISVSPINPANQTGVLNEVGNATNFITNDSDAPDSNRLAYIGMSNYDAGRMCGELIKEAMPEGGEVIIFVGRLGQLNADQRRQGIIDELLDRSNDPKRKFDPGDKVLKGDKYTILDTRTDNFDFAAAKSQVEDAIGKYPNVGAMVGLFAYNPPMILEAVKGADKIGDIKVIGFDEDDRTLEAITNGSCFGTIVQNPYMYGYKSVEVLTRLANGEKDFLPEDGFIDIPARPIKKADVDEFWTELKRLTGKSK